MAKTTIIGKVAVKVYPDTDDFREDLRRQLEREERRAEFTVPVKFDIRNAMVEFRKELLEQNRRNRTEDGRKFRLYAKIDTSNFDNIIRDANRELAERSKINPVNLTAKISDKSLEKTKIHVIPDVTKQALHDLKKKIQKELDGTKIKLDPYLPEAALRPVQLRLARLGRDRVVTYFPKVDVASAGKVATTLAALSGLRLVNDNIRIMRELFENFDKDLTKISLVGLAFAGLAAWVFSASANLFALSSQLAQIGPLGLALPGLFTGMALGLTALIVPLLDIKDVVPDVVKEWGKLRGVMSDNFWAKAKKPLQDLTEILMPQLRQGLADTATEMGGLFGKFGTDLATELTKTEALKRMFDDLAKSIEISRGATKAWATIIRVLGEQGAGLLPRLSKWFVSISKQFAGFLKRTEKSGELQDWIDRAILRLRELGRVVKQAARILYGLGTAAEKAGGTTLAGLGDSLERIANKVNSPAFQKDLVGVLKAADKAMENLANKSGPGVDKLFSSLADTAQVVFPLIGDTLGTLIGDIATALSRDGFQSGVIGLFEGIQGAVEKLSPSFGPLADALGSILDLAGHMAEAFSPAVATVLETLADAVVTMAPYLKDMVTALSGPVSDLLDRLSGPIDKIAKAAGPALSSVAEGVGAIVKGITPAVGRVADQLATFISDVAKQIAEADWKRFGEAIGKVATAIIDLVGAVIFGDQNDLGTKLNFTKGIDNTSTQLEEVATGIGGFKKTLQDFETWLDTHENPSQMGSRWNQWFKDNFGAGDSNLTSQLRAKIGEAFTGLDTWLEEKFDEQFRQPLKRAIAHPFGKDKPTWGEYIQMGKDMVAGIVKGIGEKYRDLKEKWAELKTQTVQNVKALFGIHSPSTVFAEIGRFLVDGLIVGIGDKISQLRTKVGELKTAAKEKLADAGTYLAGRGRELGSGLRDGLAAKASTVGTAAKGLLTSAKNALWNASGTLTSAGGKIVDGFVNGIRWAFWKVQSILSELTSLLPDWKGPAKRDSTILVNAGQLVIQGFVDGLESQFGAVRDTLGSLSDEIAGTTLAAPSMETITTAGADIASATRQIRSSIEVSGGLTADGSVPTPGVNVTQHIYNPTKQSDADALNQGLALAGQFGGN